jgi:hypothetical protein
MRGEEKERWMELCEQAANEQDGMKLMELVAEIDRLLDLKQRRLKPPDPTSSELAK